MKMRLTVGIAVLVIVTTAVFIVRHEHATINQLKQEAADAQKLLEATQKQSQETRGKQPPAGASPHEHWQGDEWRDIPRKPVQVQNTEEAFIGDTLTEDVSDDTLVSPYGFGPYPELPPEFRGLTWPRKNPESELMIRVHIKLVNKGVPVSGMKRLNNLIYPIIKGVRYVTWGETSQGLRYVQRSFGHPADGERIREIVAKKVSRGEVLTQADIPDIKLITLEEGGIDPYSFLDLP